MAENSNSRRNANKNQKDKAKTMYGHQPVPSAVPDMLGVKLKAYYGEIINEPIPDRLMDLMAALEAQSATKKLSDEALLMDDREVNDGEVDIGEVDIGEVDDGKNQ